MGKGCWLFHGGKYTRILFHIDILPKPFLQSIFRLGLISAKTLTMPEKLRPSLSTDDLFVRCGNGGGGRRASGGDWESDCLLA